MIDLDRIKELSAKGESLTVEFKGEEHGQLSDREIYEAVVCMANADGGLLLIGVEDDGRITGARPRHGNTTDTTKLQAAIFNNTEPRINTRISLVPIPQGNIIAIEVDRYPVGGHYFLSNVSLNRYRYVQKRSNEKFSEKFRNLPITRRYCQKSCAISLERYIKENIWHPSRVFKKGKGGSLLLSMEVGGLREVMKRF